MDEIDLLDGVLTKAAGLIDGVREDQCHLPTPCPDYDVAALLDHIVGWAQVFAAASEGRAHEGDPATFTCGDDPAGQFRAAASAMVSGWRTHGLDRKVRVTGSESPGELVFNMTLMEYLAHGWDLATATGQPVPFTEQEATEVLARAQATLPPEYRGENMSFGEIVPVADDAPAIDRLVGFLGRRPA
jgi:uncharacterized protein (TIGR03086 family)